MGDAGPKAKPHARGGSSPWMPRLRKRGEKVLHSKYVVIIVIILTIVDCSLVIAELILDLYSVKKTLSATEGQTFKFIRSIRSRYPEEVRTNDSVFSVFDRITNATILWNNSKELDFRCKFSHPDSQSTTTSTAGMSFVHYTSLGTLAKRNEDLLGAFARPVPIHQGKNLIFSNHRLRRAYASNNALNSRNPKSDNDEEIRKLPQDIFPKYLTRLRRYLSKSIQSFHDYISKDVSWQYDDNDTGRSNNHNDNYNNDKGYINATICLGEAMIKLHRQLADFVPMQLSRSASQGSEQLNLLTSSPTSRNGEYGEGNIINLDVANSFKSDNSPHSNNDDGEELDLHISSDNGHNSVTSSAASEFQNEADASGYDKDMDDDKENMQRSRRQKRDIDDDVDEDNMRRELHHSKEMEIAHKLHYASVCVVSILVIEVTMKIVCAGSHFLKRKIEVFDAVVIVTSVVVDLIFIKGLSDFAVDDSIFVLAVLLPWRVIRVVNSLVMAVIDHEHVKLRLLYSRKKKLDKTVESLRNEVDELKGMLQDVRTFCLKEGIDPSRIDGMLGKFAPRRRKDSKFYTLVKLVMSTASINNNDNDSVSSSSIENDLRHYSNRDSVLNELASNDGTMTSLKRYLSVPFSNGDSRSTSDVESVTGDQPNASPSIYITSPLGNEGRGVFNFCDVELGNDESVGFQDQHECIEEEDSVATIDVTSSTTNASAINGVAFYIGSQTFNFGLSQGTNDLTENDQTNSQCFYDSRQNNTLRDTTSSSFLDNYRSLYSQHFGQYLTVPRCTVNVSAVTNTVSTRNNNLNNSADSTNVTTAIPQSPAGTTEMRRSASDTESMTFGFSPYEGLSSLIRYGSPIPARRLPELRTRRKNYTRYKSVSDDNEHVGLLKRDFKARLRRHSGDQQAIEPGGCREESKRARSHSPSPMTLLSVPGNNLGSEGGGDNITCSSSRSMNDVSSAGNPYAHGLGVEGKILRRSCLSLNSEGRKRRGKSPHRVSFKVS